MTILMFISSKYFIYITVTKYACIFYDIYINHIVYFIYYKSIFSVPIPNYLSKEVMDILHTRYLNKLLNNDHLTKYKYYKLIYFMVHLDFK